jgi:hypothetical protein
LITKTHEKIIFFAELRLGIARRFFKWTLQMTLPFATHQATDKVCLACSRQRV